VINETAFQKKQKLQRWKPTRLSMVALATEELLLGNSLSER
jgi:hypothetical protein